MKISEIIIETAGVGIVNSQNSTKDVGPGTIRKNLKAFNLVEGPSVQSTIKAILNDTGTGVNMVYDAIEQAAKKFYDNNGTTKGFGLVAAGYGSRWVDKFYFNRLESELHDLVKYYPKSTRDLRSMLMAGVREFGQLAKNLPDYLIAIGQAERQPDLVRAGQQWKARHRQYYATLAKLKIDDQDQPVAKKPAAKAPSATGSQMSKVEEIVADILRKIPGKEAGEIRNAIARSANKLVALQQELSKRGIDPSKLKEGLVREIQPAPDQPSTPEVYDNFKLFLQSATAIGEIDGLELLYTNTGKYLVLFLLDDEKSIAAAAGFTFINPSTVQGTRVNVFKQYANRGLAVKIYMYVLKEGFTIISDERQTAAGRKLWTRGLVNAGANLFIIDGIDGREVKYNSGMEDQVYRNDKLLLKAKL